jgi:hypothetical protein
MYRKIYVAIVYWGYHSEFSFFYGGKGAEIKPRAVSMQAYHSEILTWTRNNASPTLSSLELFGSNNCNFGEWHQDVKNHNLCFLLGRHSTT